MHEYAHNYLLQMPSVAADFFQLPPSQLLEVSKQNFHLQYRLVVQQNITHY